MLSRRRTLIYIAAAVFAVLVFIFFYRFRMKIGRIASPFIMAIILTYLLSPLVSKLEARKITRNKGILLIYAVFTVAAVTVTVFIVPEFVNNTKELMNTLPDITSKYQEMFNGVVSGIQSSRWSPDIKNMVFNEVQNGVAIAQGYISNTLKKALDGIFDALTMFFDFTVAMVIAYYFIKDAEFFKNSALSLVPGKWRNGLIGTGRDVNSVLSNFIQGQLLTALIVGVLEVIGLLIIGVKYSIVLGVIGGIANIIPYFGPIIGAVPAVAVALLQSPFKAVWTVAAFVIVQQIDNNFISPKIIEGKVGLHPVTTIFAVLVGGEFFGIPGMLASVPVIAILKVLLKRVVEAIV